jgi:hypothetical protein
MFWYPNNPWIPSYSFLDFIKKFEQICTDNRDKNAPKTLKNIKTHSNIHRKNANFFMMRIYWIFFSPCMSSQKKVGLDGAWRLFWNYLSDFKNFFLQNFRSCSHNIWKFPSFFRFLFPCESYIHIQFLLYYTAHEKKEMLNGKNALQPWPGRFSLLTAWPRFTLYWKHSVHFVVIFFFFPQ